MNWYGYLVSDFNGKLLVVAYFVMIGFFGYYQYRYNKGKNLIYDQTEKK